MNTISRKMTIKNQRGFTLLEVMVALLIFSVGLLGLAGMQMAGMQSNHSAMLRTIATQQSYDIAERIRSNRAVDYVNPVGVAITDINGWNQMLASQLPSGQGQIQAAAGGGFTVTVRWDEDRTGVNGPNCNPNNPQDLKCIRLSVTP